jgi:hypothetical protein
MIKQKLREILSLNGISILIGIVGGILGILSIFIDWDLKLNIKWFAALAIILSFILIIVSKLCYDIYKSKHAWNNESSKVIKFSTNDLLFLVENQNNLEYSQSVTIFYDINGFQVDLASGFVENIQEKFVQIKIIEFDENFTNSYQEEYNKIFNNNNSALASILIKNYVKYNG